MKQGRRLTLWQKRLVAARRLDPSSWLAYKQPPGELHLVHRHSLRTTRMIKTG